MTLRATWLLTLAAVVFLPAAGVGQELEVIAPFKGTQAFRNLLNFFHLQPLTSVDELGRRPAPETLVIIFGDSSCLERVNKALPGGIKKFIKDGGAILIASDRADEGRLSDDFGVSIAGTVPTLGREQPGLHVVPYQLHDDCLLIKSYLEPAHPIFLGCNQGIATNVPSYFRYDRASHGKVLCGFPPFTARTSKSVLTVVPRAAYAIGSDDKTKERVLLLAGHGVFMNGMLGQTDNDNFRFAANTIRWLTGGKQRKCCLFVEENQVVGSFDVPLGEVPMPTARMINELLRGLEEENFFNQWLLAAVSKETILRWLLGAGLVAMTFLGIRRLWRSRLHQDQAVPVIEVAAASVAASSIPAMVRRQRLRIQSNSYWEAARVLARECFESSPGGAGATEPPAEVPGARGGGRKLRKAVVRMWALAHGENADEPLAVEAFEEVVRQAAQVKAALASGALSFAGKYGTMVK